MACTAKSHIARSELPTSLVASGELSRMTWQSFEGSAADWDSLVRGLGARTPFQFSAWATFRESFGWRSLRLVSANASSAVLFLTRLAGPIRVAWAAGGPLGNVSLHDLEHLPNDVAGNIGGVIHYLRVADHSPHDSRRTRLFDDAGWSRPTKQIVTNHTLLRELQGSSVASDIAYSSNWSRNLRRGQQRNIVAEVWAQPDPVIIARLHQEVESTKRAFTADWRANAVALQRLISCFGSQLLVVRAVDAAGQTLSIRAATINGTHAFDFLAATSMEGRKCYASNVAMHQLLVAAAARGATSYDFGGVDPQENKGVFDFKHGAGGIEHTYVGEFEHVGPRFVKPIVSKLVALRLSA